jgi:outer membrane lipase/esterase
MRAYDRLAKSSGAIAIGRHSMTPRAFRSIALASAFAFSATAAGAVGYTSFTVFGDSLSDPGNLYAAVGEVYPESPPYFEGRFSNGPVWAESIAASFAAKGLDADNFAYGAARALPTDVNLPAPVDVPDLPDQIAMFAGSGADLGSKPVASLFFGANDIIFNGLPAMDPIGIAVAAANAVADGALTLAGLGVDDFVIFNLPDLGRTPLFSLYQPAGAPFASAATLAFNATLSGRVGGLREGGLNVIDVDMYALFNDLIADPEAFGVTDVTLPCLPPGTLIACTGTDQTDRAFFDPIHPNHVIHSAIGNVVSASVAPVPLPLPGLLLLAGIAGLVGLRRRT